MRFAVSFVVQLQYTQPFGAAWARSVTGSASNRHRVASLIKLPRNLHTRWDEAE
jgi:hypothetical protein